MHYRLRTLQTLLAVGPPLLAGLWMAITDERGFVMLLIAIGMGLYAIFTFAAAFAIAWVIAAINVLIGRLQGRM